MGRLLLWEGRSAALLLAALTAGALLRRSPRRLLTPFWWVCVLRLLCPLSLPLLPAKTAFIAVPAPSALSGLEDQAGPPPAAWVLTAVWLTGTALLLLRSALRRGRLRRTLRFAVREEAEVWCCDGLTVPCAGGLLRGRVYLPFRLPEEVRRYALLHERAHLRRRDPLLLFLTEIACALHWWDPLVWIGAAALREDMELACDETVLRSVGRGEGRAYFEAMLRFAGAPPLPCFAGTQAERRVRHMAQLRPLSRRASGGVRTALALCALCGFLAARPAAETPPYFDSETAFAEAVCAAARRGDAMALSGMVRYPLTLRREGEPLCLTGPEDFRREYGRIMGPETLSDLYAADTEDLMTNWGGVMIGQGGVWFEGSAEEGFQIIAINEMK